MNDDPFTDPNPTQDAKPGVPDPDSIDADDFAAVSISEDGVLHINEDASCSDCAHFDVCAIFQGFASMINSEWGQGESGKAQEPPVDPEKLAFHCRQYDPVGEGEKNATKNEL